MIDHVKLLREMVSLVLEADDEWGEDLENAGAVRATTNVDLDHLPKGAVSVPAFIALFLLDVGSASLQEISDRVQAWRGKGITKAHLQNNVAGWAGVDDDAAYFDKFGPRGQQLYKLTPVGVLFAQRALAKMVVKGKPAKPTLRTFNVGERVALVKASDAFDLDGLKIDKIEKNYDGNIVLRDSLWDDVYFSYKGEFYHAFDPHNLSIRVDEKTPEELYDASTKKVFFGNKIIAKVTDFAKNLPQFIKLGDGGEFIFRDEFYDRFIRLSRGTVGMITSDIVATIIAIERKKNLKNCLLIDTSEGQRFVPIAALKYA